MKQHFAVSFTTDVSHSTFVQANSDLSLMFTGCAVVTIDTAGEGDICQLLEAALIDKFNAKGTGHFIVDKYVESDDETIPLAALQDADWQPGSYRAYAGKY